MDQNQDPTTDTDGHPADSTESHDAADSSPTGDAMNDARATGEKMVGQLQSMIDNIATQAAPVARQVGAKAAELAAAAADRAGPFAIKAADATADASEKLAVSARQWAADLRSKTAEEAPGANGHDASGGIAVAAAEAEAPSQPTPADHVEDTSTGI
jgi:hypothetical protein